MALLQPHTSTCTCPNDAGASAPSIIVAVAPIVVSEGRLAVFSGGTSAAVALLGSKPNGEAFGFHDYVAWPHCFVENGLLRFEPAGLQNE